ncbi:MAG: hypothetical protein LBI02_00240 [Opitutaceae bacterium]|jgi:hypothetical protein|nr:hypothetical protein [Opitutaceae bacterium]
MHKQSNSKNGPPLKDLTARMTQQPMKSKGRNIFRLSVAALLVALPSTGNAALKDVFKKKADADALYQEAFLAGDYAAALETGIQAAGKKMPEKAQILWQLHAGSVASLAGKTDDAIKFYDYADTSFREADVAPKGKKLLSNLTKGFSKKAGSYDGKIYERIMLNTSKGLAWLGMNDAEKARVEFNRMREWQAEAAERFAKEIEKERAAEEEERQKNAAPLPDAGEILGQLKFGENGRDFDQEFLTTADFKPYKDFENPYATWIAGLAALLENDTEKAGNYLREVVGMVPECKQAAEDFKTASAGQPVADRVWVIVENGLCDRLVEEKTRLPIPLPVGKDKAGNAEVVLVNCVFSLPKLVNRDSAQKAYHVEAGGLRYESELICDMDRVVRAEYDKTIRGVALRAVTHTLVLCAGQAVLNKQASKKGGIAELGATIGTGLAADALTHADTRQWTTLPGEIYIASLPIPEGRSLTLCCETGKATVEIPPCKNAIVHYRVPTTPDKAPPPRVITFNK